MKRLLAWVLVLLLLTACSGQKTHQGMVEENGVMTVYPIFQNGAWNWNYEITVTNPMEQNAAVTALRVVTCNTGGWESTGEYGQEAIQEAFPSLRSPLKPGESRSLPESSEMQLQAAGLSVIFTLTGEDGTTAQWEQHLALSTDTTRFPQKVERHQNDNAYNLHGLRHNADYRLELGEGIWWVPSNALGGTRYTNKEIGALLDLSPGEKQEKISTLYEALQLYQISGFSGCIDNLMHQERKLTWEHHKPGYDAVRTNYGCCSTSVSWLLYVLEGDYEEMGCLAYSFAQGGGHVTNYIKQDGWYYFIDMTCYRAGASKYLQENGSEQYLDSMINSGLFLLAVVQAESLEDYAAFLVNHYPQEPPVLASSFVPNEPLVPAIAFRPTEDGVELIVDCRDLSSFTILCDAPEDGFYYVTDLSPTVLPDWSIYPGFDFSQG